MNLPQATIDRSTALKMWCETHSDYAKEQMVLANQGLIRMCLKCLNQNPLDEDMFSIGIIGILKAINLFNPEKGFEFSTLATKTIQNEILKTFRKKRFLLTFRLTNHSFWITEKAFYGRI